MIFADSDVLIDSLRGRQPMTERIALEIRTGRLATTVVNLFELLAGARTAAERGKVEKLLGALIVVPLDETAAREAARIRRELEAGGQPIGMADSLIAGICMAHSGMLLTRNTAHFGRVKGLVLSNET